MPEKLVRSHRELRVYIAARGAAYRIAMLARTFPNYEQYVLGKQILRSSRSVYANLAEAWRRRRSKEFFVAKLNDCESEAAETQEWIDTARELAYIDAATAAELHAEYDNILQGLVRMIVTADKWIIPEG
jgi:four helix bundle protein